MKIVVSGATGLVGSNLVAHLKISGHQVFKLVRSNQRDDDIPWAPYEKRVDKKRLHGAEAVVHLSGENIAGRWTEAKKRRIRESRLLTTTFLCETLAELKQPPKVLVCASAVGFYGDRGDEVVDENSNPGSDFLADVCQEWEAATESATAGGIRVVNLRIGVILSPAGGALAKMLLPFKMGAGGVMGSGNQYWSWISIDDVAGAILHAITTQSLKGPVNAVSPNPVTNREFTKILGHVLSRPTIFPMPAFAVRLVFGEMGDALLLASTRVKPAKLLESGFQFQNQDLENALRHLLGKKK